MLQVQCAYCSRVHTTHNEDPEVALEDLTSLVSNHLQKMHGKQSMRHLATVQKITAYAIWIVLFAEHTKLLDTEPTEDNLKLLEAMDKQQNDIQDLLGIEDSEDDEDLEDDDEQTEEDLTLPVKAEAQNQTLEEKELTKHG